MFSKNTLDAYARQLDFFKIELGVLLPDNKIVYAYNLAKSQARHAASSAIPPPMRSAITSRGATAKCSRRIGNCSLGRESTSAII